MIIVTAENYLFTIFLWFALKITNNTLFSASVAESVKLIIDDDSENLADTRYIKVKVN